MVSENIQRIKKISHKNNGIVTAAEVRSAGISPSYLSLMVKNGSLNRIERGLYATPSVYVDKMFELFAKNKFIVFSHLSALYLHELTDRTPLKISITVPRTKNVSKLLQTGMIEIKRSNEETHDLGLIQMLSPSSFPIPVYNMERTICDIVKAKKHGYANFNGCTKRICKT